MHRTCSLCYGLIAQEMVPWVFLFARCDLNLVNLLDITIHSSCLIFFMDYV